VPHHLLLHKLKRYGICGKALDWIADFLSDRTQLVVCGGYSSEPVSVTSGVPQGSVMTVFNHTQPVLLFCLFADDCVLYRRIDSADDPNLLQQQWEETWQMKFNISKCTVLTITLKQNPLVSEYFIHGRKLTAVTEAKYLGVLLDSKLPYKHHIDATCLKANRTLAFIHRNLKSCNEQVKLDTYNVFIKPILNYAATVWTPHSRCHLNRLEAIQNCAARFIISDYRRTSSVSAIKNSLNMRSIETQHEKLRLMLFYKILHGFSNLQMPNCIIPAPRSACGNCIKFIQPPAQVDSYKFSFFPRSVHLQNRLKIDETIALNDFRNLIFD